MIDRFPTDSLYKFISIFGIVIIILPFTILPLYDNTKRNIIESELDQKKIEINLDIIKNKQENIKEALNKIKEESLSYINESKSLNKEAQESYQYIKSIVVENISVDDKTLKKLEFELNEKKDRLQQLKDILSTKDEEAKELSNENDFLYDQLNINKLLVVENQAKIDKILVDGVRYATIVDFIPYIVIIGISITLYGFYLWYNKLQKYIDIDVKRTAKMKIRIHNANKSLNFARLLSRFSGKANARLTLRAGGKNAQ